MSSLADSLAEPRTVIGRGEGRRPTPPVTELVLLGRGAIFISTTRDRAKYKIFSRDPRVELIVDDSTGHRYARVSGMVEILETSRAIWR